MHGIVLANPMGYVSHIAMRRNMQGMLNIANRVRSTDLQNACAVGGREKPIGAGNAA